MDTNKDLQLLLKEIRKSCEKEDRKILTGSLRRLMQNRRNYYQESINCNLQDEFSESLFKILLLELDEEDSESIETAELAYIGTSTVLNNTALVTPEHYKRRLLLLHYFSDYFTDALIEIFFKKYRKEHLLEARNMAMECLGKMQLSDIMLLEERYPDFIEGDEQVGDTCNAIGVPPDLSEAERKEAGLLHKVLLAYLTTKYKN